MIEHHGSNGWLFVLAGTLIVLAAVTVWWIRVERARTGSMLPWLLVGGALSSVFAATTSAALGVQYGNVVRGGVMVLGTELPLALTAVDGLVMGALPFLIARFLAHESSPSRFRGVAVAVAVGAVVVVMVGHWAGLLSVSNVDSRRSIVQAGVGIAIEVVSVIACATVIFLIKPVIRAARVALVAVPVVITGTTAGLLCPLVAVAVHDRWSSAALGGVGLAISAMAVVLLAVMGRIASAAARLLPAITYWGPTSTEYHSRRAAPRFRSH